jgi:hypothetical protein
MASYRSGRYAAQTGTRTKPVLDIVRQRTRGYSNAIPRTNEHHLAVALHRG